MDTDIFIENKDCLYGEDFLDQLTKEYQWSSFLDATDASPSEILADAAPILVPPISPILSIKSSPTESSNSDSGSEDDSKNGSISTSDRQSSQSPFDWLSSFEDEPPSNLNLEDVEQFLQKTAPCSSHLGQIIAKHEAPERNGPVMAIENGVIKGIGIDNVNQDKQLATTTIQQPTQNGSTKVQNSLFKVVNENSTNTLRREDNKIILNEQIRLVVEQKKVPSILKRSVVSHKPPNIAIPTESTKGGRIAISPLPQIVNGAKENGIHIKMSPPRNNIVLSPTVIGSKVPTLVENIAMPNVETKRPASPVLDTSHLSEAEIKILKKQQRMIKNRESACQSRQKKKEYVTALEKQLLEAHQEIARLRLENKLLRDQLDTSGRNRKIPRLDASLLIPKKNIAVIFAMIFMVSLNFNVLGWNSKPIMGPSVPHTNTRHLLWSEDSPESLSSSDYDQPLNQSDTVSDCNKSKTGDAYMNQTESIRIVGELNRWINGGKKLNWTYDAPRKKKVYVNTEKIDGGLLETYKLIGKLNMESDLVDFPSINKKNIKEKTRLRRLRKSKEVVFPETVYDYEGLYNSKPLRAPVDFGDFGEWNALLQALQRRDDTFYVVGVGKGEHLLLPAVSHNDTRPPKMALILPAKTGNDSIMSDHVTLMQIDCSVVNTTIVKLKSDALPGSLRSPVIKPENKPENKRSYHLRRPKITIEDTIPDPLQNSSNNYPVKFKTGTQMKDIHQQSKDDLFSKYLITKYTESKNSNSATVEDSVSISNSTEPVLKHVNKNSV